MSLIGQLKKRTWELKHSCQTLMKMMMASVSDCCGVHPPTTLLILTHSHPLHPSPTCTLFIPHPLTHAFTQPLTLIPLTYIHLSPPTHSDEFTTPPSSPPSEEDQPDGASLSQNMKPQDLQNALQAVSTCPRPRDDPFDRYILRLSDLQILIGKADDLWREAVKSGQSSLHLLDKFTLSVQIQRCVIY